MRYKRKLATLIACLIAVGCAALMPAQARATTCDASTVAGSYGVRLNSFFAPSTPQGFLPISSFTPGVFAGRIVFDGTSSVSGFLAGNSGGVPESPTTFTGTYAVNSDCTGTLTRVLPDGKVREYEITIVQSGADIEFANTSASPLQIVGEGVAKRTPVTCDATTIAGSYGFRFNLFFTTAPTQPKTFLHLSAFEAGALTGRIVFDSTTNPPSISGFRAGNTGGRPVSSTFSGTYSVNSDCTGTVNQVFVDQVRQHAIAIVRDGDEIEFTNTTVSPRQPGPIFEIVGGGVAKKR